jgi:IS5 family transposase
MSIILAEQILFRPPLPLIYGCKDYREQRQLFERIDQILELSNADHQFLQISLQHHQQPGGPEDGDHHGEAESNGDADQPDLESDRDPEPEPEPIPGPIDSDGVVNQGWLKHTRAALRVNLARLILGLSFRVMSSRLADSILLQWFCGIGEFGAVKPPSKSTVHRYANWVDAEHLQPLIEHIVQQAGAEVATDQPAQPDEAPDIAQRSQPLKLEQPVDLTQGWLDPTCIKANIHFPTDWVLLRDGTRTLMKATLLIRRRGLKTRMPKSPEEFLSDMNKLAIEMTQTRRQKNGKKMRKAVLRKMAKLEKKIRAHGRRHRDILDQRWSETDLTRPQAEQIIKRIDSILERLPEAVRQARERIIGGRLVPSKDKILSLYEPDINTVVRGKADAEVEFGNTLWLTEQREGLIIDWKLYQDPVADNAAKPFAQTLDRLMEVTDKKLETLWTDRGMDSLKNRQALEKQGVSDGIMPKNPKRMSEKMAEKEFAAGQRRRASTEGRIGLFKNDFLGKPLRAKGFKNRENAVAWALLTHNLWVLARLPQAEEEDVGLAAAA